MDNLGEFETVAGLGNREGMKARGLDRVGVEQYLSEEFYQQELDTIWRRCWLWAGRASDIPKPGDYFVFKLPFANNTQIIVIRGKDGRIRGFYNVCQHRGARLAYYERGSCRGFTCTFHGWGYDFEGKLVAVPHKKVFGDIDQSQYSLKPVSVDTWGGWVFVNLDSNPRWTLGEYLAPVPKALGDYFENEPWTWGWGRKGLFKCNWKLQVDSQAEGHHAPYLHGRSIMAPFDMADVPVWAYIGSPGVPYKLEVYLPDAPEGSGVFQSALAKAVARYSTVLYYNTDSDQHRKQTDADKYKGAVNVSNEKRWAFDLYQIFPNTVIIVQKTHLLIMRSWPRGVGETLWDYDHYFITQPNNFGEHVARLHGLIELRNTITEDMSTVEGLFDGYSSGAVTEMLVSEAELGVSAFERHVMQMVQVLSA